MNHILEPEGSENLAGRFLLRHRKSPGLCPTPSNTTDYRAELEGSRDSSQGGPTEAYSRPNWVALKSSPRSHPFKATRLVIDLEPIIKPCSTVYAK